jgi:hypothetical protein
VHDTSPEFFAPNSFVGAVMPDSDQFSVNLTDICGRNAVRLYELLIQASSDVFAGGRRFLKLQASSVVFQNFGATAGTVP